MFFFFNRLHDLCVRVITGLELSVCRHVCDIEMLYFQLFRCSRSQQSNAEKGVAMVACLAADPATSPVWSS
jgi:hypothetical protein